MAQFGLSLLVDRDQPFDESEEILMGPFILQKLIPQEYLPLMRAISPSAFSVVDWKPLVRESPQLLKRISQREGVEALRLSLGTKLPSATESTPNIGQAALEIYFAQILSTDGLFLDLRRKHFSIDENQKVSFSPNGFWVQWQEPFRSGLLKIYSGYYESQMDKIDLGLAEVGLIHNEMSPDKVLEVRNMLLSHIGGDYNQQKFLIADFTASFERFFDFLLKNKIQLSVDFLYLGIYLASLYHCLQEVGGTYDVQKCFLKVKGRIEN